MWNFIRYGVVDRDLHSFINYEECDEYQTMMDFVQELRFVYYFELGTLGLKEFLLFCEDEIRDSYYSNIFFFFFFTALEGTFDLVPLPTKSSIFIHILPGVRFLTF